MKIFLKTFAMVFVIILAFTACSSKVHHRATNKKVVEFWTLQLGDFAPYINSVIKKYEKIHPDIKIKWIDVPFSEGEKRSLAAVMSKNVPDIINMNPSFASTLAARGALIDVKKYVPHNVYDTYLSQSWNSSTLGSTTFGIPWYITSAITIYNVDLMKRAGLNPSLPPKTFDDLVNYSKIIKEKTDLYAFMPNLTEDGQLIKMLNKDGISILSKNGKVAAFNNNAAVKKLDELVFLYRNNYIPRESITETHRATLEQYQAGDIAFIFAGPNFLRMIKDNAPKVYKNTAIAPQIVGKNKKVDFSIMNLVIPVKSKHKKEAVDFSLFLTNTENQLEFCKLAPVLPSTRKGINADMFKKAMHSSDIMQKGQAISANQLNIAITPVPLLKEQSDLYEIVDSATQQALLGVKTPKQALNNAVKSWNEILKEEK